MKVFSICQQSLTALPTEEVHEVCSAADFMKGILSEVHAPVKDLL